MHYIGNLQAYAYATDAHIPNDRMLALSDYCPAPQVARPYRAAGLAGVQAGFVLTPQECSRATVLIRRRLCLRRGFRPVLLTRLQAGCLQEAPVSLMRRRIPPGFRASRFHRLANLRPRCRPTRAFKSVRHPGSGRIFRPRFDGRH